MCGSELKQTLKERKTKPAKSLMNIIKTKEKGRKNMHTTFRDIIVSQQKTFWGEIGKHK